MAVAAAERTSYLEEPRDLYFGQPADVIAVTSLPEEDFVLRQAERFIRFVGNTVTSRTVAENSHVPKSTSLMEAIKSAAKGNEVALRLVQANVSTDVLERTIKAGLILEADLEVDDQGNIVQHGQSQASIQENTLLYASGTHKMRARAEAETRNKFRIDNAYKSGLLKDYNFVVFSRTPDNMTAEELEDAGYFIDSMPVSIQATSLTANGLKVESAFVAGVKEPGAALHDQQMIASVGHKLGINYEGLSATETIDTPVLIHKKLMPGGVSDLVKLADDCNGGTFFGEDRPRQDYVQFKQACMKRALDYAPKVQKIMGELLARVKYINNPVDAVRLLDKLADQNMVEQAIYDDSINPLVFGTKAAPHIIDARIHLENGDTAKAEESTQKAQSVSSSRSCPSALLASEASVDGAIEEGAETWHGGKKYYNSKCSSCKKIKPEVGACHICKDCVHNPRKMKKAYDEDKRKLKVVSKKEEDDKVIDLRPEHKEEHLKVAA